MNYFQYILLVIIILLDKDNKLLHMSNTNNRKHSYKDIWSLIEDKVSKDRSCKMLLEYNGREKDAVQRMLDEKPIHNVEYKR